MSVRRTQHPHLSDEVVSKSFTLGSEAHPDISLDEVAFRRHLDRLSRDKEHFVEGFAKGVWADLFVAFACLERDVAAVRLLEVHLRAAEAAVRRQVPGCDGAEVIQELAARLLGLGDELPKLATYTGAGPLAAFVRVSALRLALTAVRAGARRREGTLGEQGSVTVNPERLLLQKEHAARAVEAVRASLGTLDPERRETLRRYYFESCSLEDLAAFLGVSRATAARRLAEAREQVLRAARQHVERTLGVGAAEAEGILRRVTLEVTLGLSTAFGFPGA